MITFVIALSREVLSRKKNNLAPNLSYTLCVMYKTQVVPYKLLLYLHRPKPITIMTDKQRLDQIEEVTADMIIQLGRIEGNQVELKKDIIELKKNQVELKKNQVELKTDVLQIKEDLQRVANDSYHNFVYLRDTTVTNATFDKFFNIVLDKFEEIKTEMKAMQTEMKEMKAELKTDIQHINTRMTNNS
jgi:hypothetical protein